MTVDNTHMRELSEGRLKLTANGRSRQSAGEELGTSTDGEDRPLMTVARKRSAIAFPSSMEHATSARLSVAWLTQWLWPAVLLVSAVATNIMVIADSQLIVRPLIAFWFLLVCPGASFVRLLRLQPFAAELALSIALSLAIDTIVVGALLYSGTWSPLLGLVILGCLSVVGAAAQAVRILIDDRGSNEDL